MKITPRTLQEISERALIAKGTYTTYICYAHADTSQFGSEMLVITQDIITRDGEVIGRTTDRITENLEGGEKLRNFCRDQLNNRGTGS